jgi:hypothetical protein
MAIQMQVLPPPAGGHNPITVAGRSYTGAPGSFLTVPYQDGLVMLSNGWTTNSVNGCGATIDRPSPRPGMTFLDTTIGAHIVWDGGSWRHTLTGAAV